MEDWQIEEIEQALRAFAAERGLTWVVEDVDRDIAAGVTESKQLRKSTKDRMTIYMEVDEPSHGRRGAEDFLTQRPMTVRERTLLLLSAIERVAVSPRSIAAYTLADMRDEEDRRPSISGITFQPDLEFGQSPDTLVDMSEFANSPGRSTLRSTLHELRELIEE